MLLGRETPVLAYLKLALIVMSLVIVTVIVRLVPLASPDQPIQGEPAAGVAVSVTTVPAAKVEPEGLTLTVPFPTVFVTSLYCAVVVEPEVPPVLVLLPPAPVLTVTFMLTWPPTEFHTVTVAGAASRTIEPLNTPCSNCMVPIGEPFGPLMP